MPSPPATTRRSMPPAAMAARPFSRRSAGVGRAEVEDVDPRGAQQGQRLGADPRPGVLARGRVDDEPQASRHAGRLVPRRPWCASWDDGAHASARPAAPRRAAPPPARGAPRPRCGHRPRPGRRGAPGPGRGAVRGPRGVGLGRVPRRRPRDPRGRRHLRARPVHLHRRRRLGHPLLLLAAPRLADDARRRPAALALVGALAVGLGGLLGIEPGTMAGAYAGALTNTPALAAASARAADPARPRSATRSPTSAASSSCSPSRPGRCAGPGREPRREEIAHVTVRVEVDEPITVAALPPATTARSASPGSSARTPPDPTIVPGARRADRPQRPRHHRRAARPAGRGRRSGWATSPRTTSSPTGATSTSAASRCRPSRSSATRSASSTSRRSSARP